MKLVRIFDKISNFKKISLLLIIAISLVNCDNKPDDRFLTTFTGDMIYSYLKKDSLDQYSEFVKYIDATNLKGMLSAYGEYTCLAPVNDAFDEYYREAGIGGFEDMSEDDIKYITRTHIINKMYLTEILSDGIIPNVNMNDRVIEINFSADSITGSLNILLNKESLVIEKDIEVYNGVIHSIDKLITPSRQQLPYLIEAEEDLSIFSAALELTGMKDSLLYLTDMEYDVNKLPEYKDEFEKYTIPAPASRKYGYTAFVESDAVFQEHGIFSIDDLIREAATWYTNESGVAADDYTNRGHSLNKFISYHLVEKMVNTDDLFYSRSMAKDIELYEFLETMYTYRLIKVSNKSESNSSLGINNAILNPNSASELFVTGRSKTTINGVYHVLDDILLYSTSVEDMLKSTRIRFDMTSLLPEMMNNKLRHSESQKLADGDRYGIPPGYFKYLDQSEHTRFIYLSGKEMLWQNYQADEMMGLGNYDMTIRLLPVPPGTYELRFGYSANYARSVTQMYVDGKPVGIPLDLRIGKTNPKIGWVPDNNTEDEGVEVAKAMRNRGYMNSPTSMVWNNGGITPLRNSTQALRRVVGTFTFDEYGEHTIRFRSVLEKLDAQMMMDYFEFVPKSIYEPIGGEPEARD